MLFEFDDRNRSDALFESEPFPHIQRSLGLFRPLGQRVVPRAVICIAIGWLPLCVFVVVSALKGSSNLVSFITDYGVHARSLVAAPLFVVCELVCLKRLEEIVRYFLQSGLINEPDKIPFRKLIDSNRKLMTSTVAEIIAILVAYLLALILFRVVSIDIVPSWYLDDRAIRSLSLAGGWYVFVSVPLLIILILGWLWRVLLWSRFLFYVACMKLNLISAHPDHASGLKFLNASIFAFMPLAFTLGLIVAGSAANRVAYRGATWENLQSSVVGLLIVVLILFVGPLLLFVFKLHHQKIKGILSYGNLAHSLGQQFENKWLVNNFRVRPDALEVPDFSATTDLYGVVSNVYNISVLPFEVRALIALCVATLLPFIPVLIMALPMKVILNEVATLLF